MKSVAKLFAVVFGIIMLTCSDPSIVGGTDETHSGVAQNTFAGYVYRGATNQPVSNAPVRIYRSAPAMPEGHQDDIDSAYRQWFDSRVRRTVRTDDSGYFEFVDFDSGSYALEVEIQMADSLRFFTWTGEVFSDTVVHLDAAKPWFSWEFPPWKLFNAGYTGTEDSVYMPQDMDAGKSNSMLIIAGDVIVDSIYVAACDSSSGSCAVSFGFIGPVMFPPEMYPAEIPEDYRWTVAKGEGAYSAASAEYTIESKEPFFYLEDFAFEDGRDSGQQSRSATLVFLYRQFFRREGFGLYGADTLVVHEYVP